MMNTHSTSQPTETTSNARHRNAGIILILVAFALKLPLVVLTAVYPTGAGDIVPDSGGTVVSGLGNTAFLLSAAVLVYLRRWVGMAVAAVLVIGSTIGGIQLLNDGSVVWGALQLATNALAAIGIVWALATGALRGSRW